MSATKHPKGSDTLSEDALSPPSGDEAHLAFFKTVEDLSDKDDLPTDLAHQHDHYLYGTPKKQG